MYRVRLSTYLDTIHVKPPSGDDLTALCLADGTGPVAVLPK